MAASLRWPSPAATSGAVLSTRRTAVVTALIALLAGACSGSGPSAPAPAAAPGSDAAAPRSDAVAPRSTAAPTPSPGTTASSPGRPVTLAFGGDVHFEGASAAALFGGLDAIAPVLSSADFAMVNLETAVTEGGSPAAKSFVFRAPPRAFSSLAEAGVDAVTMANNHGMDYGVVGLRDSLAAARSANFPVVGIGLDADAAYAPLVTTVAGQRVAVLGATQVLDANLEAAWTAGAGKPGLASAKDEQRLLAAVRAVRPRADTVVVDLHWGQERNPCPLPRQQSLARALVAAGADVVVGSHAHVLLGGGFLGGAYVDYGLGNFVFYAQEGPGAQTGVLVLTVQSGKVTDATWHSAVIRSGVPRSLAGAAAAQAVAAKDALRTRCTDLAASPS